MSIRLNKAIRELNIGLQTAVEFLEKKPNLGEVKGDPNFKLSDAQYEALATQFNKDKQVKAIADKKFPKKSKEGGKKKQSQGGVKRGDDGLTKIQAYTPLGKIDLDQLNRKPGQKTDQKPKADQPKAKEEKPVRKQEPQQPKQEQPKSAQKEATPQHKAEPKAEKPAVKEQPKETAHKEVAQKPAAQKENAQKENTQKENKEQAKPAAKAVETEQKPAKPAKSEKPQPAAAAQTETAQKEGKEQEPATTEGGAPFQTQNEKKLLNQPKLNVLGKLDLSTINQNTRPKKKSKEERRKEREEKNGQGKKKRVRINKERVDINAAANQQPAQQGKKQGQQQQQGQADGGGKRKKKNRGRSNKPLEVDDEAVARQVKETLARLTSKTQNKKGAKYRKEKRDAAQEKLNQEARAERKQSKTLKLTEFVTVSELATMMDVPVTKVISTLMSVGIMVSINQRLDAEALVVVAEEFGYKVDESEKGDLTTEAERLSYDWVKKHYGHEFLFITDYSAEKRAFYHMRDENGVPQGYDLIWRGVEITTGAQREHRYEVLKKQAEEKGLAEDVKFYLEFFQYGCPPHGGFGLGIDRLTMLLCGLSIKDAEFLFRGPNRLTP